MGGDGCETIFLSHFNAKFAMTDPRQHNQCGSKQSKHRRSSFGNGLLKFFGRTSSGKERTLSSRENESQTSADMHPELSPHPPPYRVLHPIPCSSANFVQNVSANVLFMSYCCCLSVVFDCLFVFVAIVLSFPVFLLH